MVFPAGEGEPEVFGERVEIDRLQWKNGLFRSSLTPALGESDQFPVSGFVGGAPEMALVYACFQ